MRDRSLLDTRGGLPGATLGLRWTGDTNWELLSALAWTPLSVRQPQQERRHDDLWSLRLMLRRRLR